MSTYGLTGELTGLADWIDSQLSDELASRQFIAEHASARLRDIAAAVDAGEMTEDEACGHAAAIPPLETERQARELPAVRAVWAAFDADPGPGKMAPHTERMLLAAMEPSGVVLGAYDRRIIAWLAGWEPQTCAVIAGLIQRAATLAEPRVREVLEEATRAAAEAAVSAYVRGMGLPAPRDGDR